MTQVERSVLRYFGGKWAIAPWVIENMPPHNTYVEPFGGGASVLMRKPAASLEVYNDLNKEIVNVFRVLQDKDNASELQRRISFTPYSRDEYDLSYELTECPIETARRTIIRAFVGFGSNGANRIDQKTGFRSRMDWKTDEYAEAIPGFTARLRHVIIENSDAKAVMTLHDSRDTLHFVDPPYVKATRGKSFDRYVHELDDQGHVELCEFLKELKGMVMLAGYPNELYDRMGWQRIQRDALADGQRDRMECLWLNPACQGAQTQASLFAGTPAAGANASKALNTLGNE